MKLIGKQIVDLTQGNMFIETNTILVNDSVTNKEYVITKLNEGIGTIHQAIVLNKSMIANVATIGEKACNTAVVEFPISNVMVELNGVMINVGAGLDCYFSPDGTTIRDGGNAQKGDYLYWNATYDLDTNDDLSFIYLVAYNYFPLGAGTTAYIQPINNTVVVKYLGNAGTTMNVVLESSSITVGNVGGAFVWDIGGADEHTFTSTNESIVVTVNGENYTIWFDGYGSLIYSIRKGGTKNDTPIDTNPVYYIYPSESTFNFTSVNNNIYSLGGQDTNGNYLIGGDFTLVNGTLKSGVAVIDYTGSVNTSFIGSGINSDSYGIYSCLVDNTNQRYILSGNMLTSYNGSALKNSYGGTAYTFSVNFNGTLFKVYDVNLAYCSILDDDKYVIGSHYMTSSASNTKGICRINIDGTEDTTFNSSGIGFRAQYALNEYQFRIGAILKDGTKYVVGGNFYYYNNVKSVGIIRLNSDGSIDTSFVTGTGFNGYVTTIIKDGLKYIVGGEFTNYNGVSANKIIRLNSDGSIDTTFNIGTGCNNTIQCIRKDTSLSKFVICGDFTNYNGVSANRIIRLNSDGSIDTSFVTGTGFNASVVSLYIDGNNRYVVGGWFTTYKGVPINALVRLNSDGSINK